MQTFARDLIETADEIMIFCSDTNLLDGTTEEAYVDIVRRACAEMRKVVAHRIGGTIGDANPIVAAALDVRNCALYGLGNFVQKDGKQPGQCDSDIAVVGVLPKSVFASTGLEDPVLGGPGLNDPVPDSREAP